MYTVQENLGGPILRGVLCTSFVHFFVCVLFSGQEGALVCEPNKKKIGDDISFRCTSVDCQGAVEWYKLQETTQEFIGLAEQYILSKKTLTL